MPNQIEYYLSLVSPWTYLGHQRLVELSVTHDVPIKIMPVKLGEIFPVTGGLPLPKRAPARQAYRLTELVRWSEFLGIALNPQPLYFPANDLLACRLVTTLRGTDPLKAITLAGAILKATWVEERNVADEKTLREICSEHDVDADALFVDALSEAIDKKLDEDTARAIEKGVFGAPSYVFNDELFWGQDRLLFLAERLSQSSKVKG